MGVMICSRSNCQNIMCDLYSSSFGYVCQTCYNELEAKMESDQPTNITEYLTEFKKTLVAERDSGLDYNKILRTIFSRGEHDVIN